MDKYHSQRSLACSSMQTPWAPSFELLLRAGGAECLRSCPHESSRRDLHRVAFLRFPKDYAGVAKRRTPNQSQTDTGDYAEPWTGWESTGSQHLKGPSRPSQVSISSTRSRDLSSPASMELGHHVYPIEKRLCLPRCRNRLVQSTGTLPSSLEQSGDSFLSGGIRGGHSHLWTAGYFQYRPRSAVHLSRVCECGSQQGHPVQHGRTRKSPRQYFRRASMEVGKI